MGHRILKIACFYPEAIRDAYAKGFVDEKASSEIQTRQIFDFAFSWSDFHSRALRDLGQDATDLIHGVKPLMNRIRQERGQDLCDKELLIAMIRERSPEILWLQEPLIFSSAELQDLEKSLPQLKLVVGAHCAPFSAAQVEHFRLCDFMMTCSPSFVKAFGSAGLRTALIPHAFSPSIVSRIPKIPFEDRECDFLFSGSLIGREGFHMKRIQFLESMAKMGVQMKILAGSPLGTGPKKLIKEGLATMQALTGFKSAKVEEWRKARWPAVLRRAAGEPVYGIEMFQAVSRSKIVFNVHAEVAGNYAANVRLFEVTGAGAVLLTDHKDNIRDYFEPDSEIVTYRSLDEALEKVRWLLQNPKQAAEIARRGQERCLRDHNYDRRARLLLDEIDKCLSKG